VLSGNPGNKERSPQKGRKKAWGRRRKTKGEKERGFGRRGKKKAQNARSVLAKISFGEQSGGEGGKLGKDQNAGQLGREASGGGDVARGNRVWESVGRSGGSDQKGKYNN